MVRGDVLNVLHVKGLYMSRVEELANSVLTQPPTWRQLVGMGEGVCNTDGFSPEEAAVILELAKLQ